MVFIAATETKLESSLYSEVMSYHIIHVTLSPKPSSNNSQEHLVLEGLKGHT